MKNQQKQNNKRRDFIKKGVAGIAGLSVFPSAGAITSQTSDRSATVENRIIYRTLGRTGYKVPIVSMGSSTNEYIIKASLKKGIKLIDTAYIYGKGLDETTIGAATAGLPRDSFIIASKVYGLRDNNTGMPLENITPEEFKDDFRKSVDTSLKRLRLDYLDILFLHAADNPELVKMDMVKDVLKELKNEGKTKFIGVSTHTNSVIYSIVEEEIYDVILIGYNFRDEETGEGHRAIEHAANAGCGIIGMKSLGGVFWDEERKQRINQSAAAKWIMQDENVHTTIFTMNNFGQLEMYMSLMNDPEFTPEDRKELRLGEPNVSTGLYCNQCETCIPQCPYGMDVPKLMRSYMYAYAYNKPAKAKETLSLLHNKGLLCTDCVGGCTVNCPMGFDVRRKISDITRIMDVPDEFLV
ncbi:MAG: aldo/keto reductase [Bacteroidales bacterium]|jgi:predicted aldo/keto reductase-like oxidoreductase